MNIKKNGQKTWIGTSQKKYPDDWKAYRKVINFTSHQEYTK